MSIEERVRSERERLRVQRASRPYRPVVEQLQPLFAVLTDASKSGREWDQAEGQIIATLEDPKYKAVAEGLYKTHAPQFVSGTGEMLHEVLFGEALDRAGRIHVATALEAQADRAMQAFGLTGESAGQGDQQQRRQVYERLVARIQNSGQGTSR